MTSVGAFKFKQMSYFFDMKKVTKRKSRNWISFFTNFIVLFLCRQKKNQKNLLKRLRARLAIGFHINIKSFPKNSKLTTLKQYSKNSKLTTLKQYCFLNVKDFIFMRSADVLKKSKR
ncbi:MAG: hypothetical protein B5M52_06310 [Helicobacteraceae bacterium 4484_230]|nr:MAG: hypothetical protein B5M52_06310 [Helicobacteraceae bacterium 4484_230]